MPPEDSDSDQCSGDGGELVNATGLKGGVACIVAQSAVPDATLSWRNADLASATAAASLQHNPGNNDFTGLDGVVLFSHFTVLETGALNKKRKKKRQVAIERVGKQFEVWPPTTSNRAQAIFSSSEQHQEHPGQNTEQYSSSFIHRLQ